MGAGKMPAAEVHIDDALVRALLAEQHPDLAALSCRALGSGWDNAIFRLGDELTVRLPRRQMASVLVEHEQRWLPDLAPSLPLRIPAPVRIGTPGRGYPWSWSVCAWLPGEIAANAPPGDPIAAAESLGRFLAALHVPAPPDAPPNLYRGGPLIDRAAAVHDRVERLGNTIDGPAVLARWAELVATPPWTGSPLWLHGDLHPANILVRDGRLSAVIDFGDITTGDPATDLSVAWMMFPPQAGATFRRAAGDVDDDTWARARLGARSRVGVPFGLGRQPGDGAGRAPDPRRRARWLTGGVNGRGSSVPCGVARWYSER